MLPTLDNSRYYIVAHFHARNIFILINRDCEKLLVCKDGFIIYASGLIKLLYNNYEFPKQHQFWKDCKLKWQRSIWEMSSLVTKYSNHQHIYITHIQTQISRQGSSSSFKHNRIAPTQKFIFTVTIADNQPSSVLGPPIHSTSRTHCDKGSLRFNGRFSISRVATTLEYFAVFWYIRRCGCWTVCECACVSLWLNIRCAYIYIVWLCHKQRRVFFVAVVVSKSFSLIRKCNFHASTYMICPLQRLPLRELHCHNCLC